MKQNLNQLIQQIQQLFNENKYKEIIALLPDELLTQYRNGQLFAWLARTYDRLDESHSALLYANKAIEIDPTFPLPFRVRGNVWYNEKKYDKAIDDYSKAIVLDEKYADAYYNRGIAWHDKKEYDKAIDDYTKTIVLDEKYADAYYNRGIAWHDKKEYDKAIDDYTKTIVLDEKYADAYYNRAISYETVQEFNKAISDYLKYIELINNPENYYSQVAQSAIKELNKKIANSWYTEIAELVSKIKKLLLFEHDCITHYTSLSSAKAMILSNSKFRLSEGAFLNDTSEGRELFEYLNFSTVKEKSDKTLAEYFSEKPFIGSFVTDAKHDDLTLWRMYGKEDKIEAKGCALTINKDLFLSNLKNSIVGKEHTNTSIQSDEQFMFYKVAYVTKDGENEFVIPGDSQGSRLTKLMRKLKVKIKVLSKEQEMSVKELLNGIAYLFKSAEYQYENEVRLIVHGVGFEKTIEKDANPPRVFIQMVELIPALTKITFGPKVERADEWAAAFNYQIKKESPNSSIEIVISHLPFK